jgi:hypothetical protein
VLSAQSQRIEPLWCHLNSRKSWLVLNHLTMRWQSGPTSLALVLMTVILEMKRAHNSCYAFCLLY